jgi:hypothetical protein
MTGLQFSPVYRGDDARHPGFESAEMVLTISALVVDVPDNEISDFPYVDGPLLARCCAVI